MKGQLKLINTASEIDVLHDKLEEKYKKLLRVNPDLNRTLVSFQANKRETSYRWYKFKEGYSSALVSYYLDTLKINEGKVLDPFAGSGTSLFVSAGRGLDSVGLELLPIGNEIMSTRYIVLQNRVKVLKLLSTWIQTEPWKKEKKTTTLNHLNITRGAFPIETELSIGRYLTSVGKITDPKMRRVLRFSLLCILESISYTRKDGQYLRWDHRSGRRPGKTQFDKGEIKPFDTAIKAKLVEMFDDLSTAPPVELNASKLGNVELIEGSCLDTLPKLKDKFDLIITSPPYCNRYDYTRTYALELMLLGIGEEKVKELRQTMLTCTVENREKKDLAEKFTKNVYAGAQNAFTSQKYLNAALDYLEMARVNGELNNSGIVRMVRNYFFELSLLIFEAARVTKKNGYFVMVNDNVRYAGIHIPVDLILSDFAESAGFKVIEIQVLPRGKGNSSQQMGKHGRTETRKCVYIWRKL